MSDSPSDPPPSPSSILYACSTGNSPELQHYFSLLNIQSPHPLIYYPSPPPPSAPPTTLQMLEAAISSKQPNTLSLLLTTFPTVALTPSLISLAIQHADVATFTVLLRHDPSALNLNLGHDSTPLSKACFGEDPALALFLLQEGADPNAGWWFRLSTLGVALMQGQPVELVRALVEAGAETAGEIESAWEEGREGDLRVLREAGVDIDAT